MTAQTKSERRPGCRSPLRRVRIPAAGVLLLVLVGGVSAHTAAASTLAVGGAGVGSGFASVSPCGDLSAATVAYTVTAGNLTGVVVSALPAGCDGKQLSVTLLQGSSAVAQAGPVTVVGGVATFATLSANPVATSVTSAALVGVG